MIQEMHHSECEKLKVFRLLPGPQLWTLLLHQVIVFGFISPIESQ